MKKTVLVFLLICVLVLALISFLIYCGYRNDKLLSDYNNCSKFYRSTVGLPIEELNKLPINDSLSLADGAVLTRITYDEYLRMLALKEDSSGKTKQSIITDDEALSFYGYKKEYGLDGTDKCEFRAQMEGVVILSDKDSDLQLVDAVPLSTTLTDGLYTCKWVQIGLDIAFDTDADGSIMKNFEFIGNGYFVVEFRFPFNLTTNAGWNSPTLWMDSNYQYE